MSMIDRLSLKGAGLFIHLAISGCRPLDMYDQPRVEPYEASDIFPDGRASRHPPEGTFPKAEGGEAISVALGIADLKRGRQRFDAFCSPCHGFVGRGDGMIVQRGFPRPPSLHEARLKDAQDDYLFTVIGNGIGTMPPYAPHVPLRDRWLIVAYIRALQLSQNVPNEELSEKDRQRLEGTR